MSRFEKNARSGVRTDTAIDEQGTLLHSGLRVIGAAQVQFPFQRVDLASLSNPAKYIGFLTTLQTKETQA